MNLILKVAKSILQDLSTVADALADGKVSLAENLQMKFRGMTRTLNLKALMPESLDELKNIAQFDDLSEEQVAFITDGKNVPIKFVKKAYDIALAQYDLVDALLEEDPEAVVDLPSQLPLIPLDQVPGVGPATVETLMTLGIKTVKQLAEANVESLKEGFKTAGKTPAITAKVESFVLAAKKLIDPTTT